eukprot:678178-Pyramimonas_sp.AAC.1
MLPKPGGGTRLIALMNTLLRIWGRSRRPISVQWELNRRRPSFWGGGAGRTSSDCSFQLNLVAEAAHARTQHVIAVCLDLFRCYETILWSMVMTEARELGFPIRLMWTVLQTYMVPRTILADSNVSTLLESFQGILAGCTHATTVFMLVLYRVVDRQYKLYPQVCARVLLDDITMQRHGPDPRGASVLNTCVRKFASDT